MKKLNIVFCSYPDYSGNARALYKYMKKKYKDSMNYTWVVSSDESQKRLLDRNIDSVVLGSNDYTKNMNNADVFFTTHCNITGDKPDNAIYIELWHGLSSKKIGFMVNNISDSDLSWYKHLSKTIDYIIVPSEFWKVIFATRFNIEFNQVLSLGYPKLDEFKNKNASKNLCKVLNIEIDKYKKVIYYMPTFRKGCGRVGDSEFGNNILNLCEYDESILVKYLKDNNYLLCIKKHPSEESNFLNSFENSENIKLIKEEYLENNGFDVYDILDAADILVTDYSSLGVEFLYLEKPVIYISTDVDMYMKNRGICYSNFDFWSSNTSINTIDQLIEKIDNYCSSGYFDVFAEKRKLFFGNLKNGGCSAICSYFFNNDGTLTENAKPYINDLRKLSTRCSKLEYEKNYYERLSAQKQDELNLVYNSRAWKILEKLRNLRRKIFK
ncbi:MAG: hypothetical protein E7160_03885 [Firmicutes bacterium]|nr:hypothetical protein [Bacillota bacterium]